MPDIICKDADASVYNVGYDQPWLPTLGSTLFGFYMLGTAAPLDVLKDYSGNGRDLIRTGAPVESAASSAMVPFPDGYMAPFTGNDLFSASGGAGFTILAVVRSTADAVAIITGCSDLAVTKHVGLFTNASSDVQAAVRNGGSGSTFVSVPETAYRSTGFYFVGGLWVPSAVSALRKNPDGGVVKNTTATSITDIGGTVRFGIGRYGEGAPNDSTYPDPIEIAALAYYAKPLSDAEITAGYAGMQAAVHDCGGLTI